MANLSIYLSDEVYGRVKLVAGERGVSVSRVISDMFSGSGGESQLDRIESKLDQVICGFGDFPAVGLKNGVVGGKGGKSVAGELSIRERYKLSHPREMCPGCHQRNEDCRC